MDKNLFQNTFLFIVGEAIKDVIVVQLSLI